MTSIHFSLFFLALFSLFSSTQIHGKCLNDQKSYLLQFRGGLHINPIFSVKLVYWKESIDCCEWAGVACDDLGHVVSLKLDNELSSIRNESWKAVFSLRYLEELNLAFNRFARTIIPVELSKLTRMKHLNFSESGFIGEIPIGLSNMAHLVTLDLSDWSSLDPLQVRELGGLEVLVQNLTELREIYLDNVNISAQGRVWCNTFSTLWKLQVLSLSNCHLSGPIFPSLSNLTSLSTLQLDYNDLSSKIPEFFTNYSNLRILTLGSCRLYGQFPEKYFNIPTLESLDVSANNLVGSMPQFLKHQSLKKMVLMSNNFSGSLSDSIGYLGALTILDLTDCNFDGKIPITLTNLSELAILDLSRNKFSGSIPPLHMFQNLVEVDLSDNAFTGSIPSEYFKGLHLSRVNLEYNSFSGSFPSSLFSLPHLTELYLSHNKFDGGIEDFLNISSSLLEFLDLSYNNFNGSLRLYMFNRFQNLCSLDLSYNNLTIDVSCNATSACLSSFPQLLKLKLASCNLKMLPDLKNQTEMITLDLSLNSITGEIPSWIWKIGMGSRSYVNLSFNYFDNIQKPYKFDDLLEVLDLRDNLLKGDIPMPPKEVIYIDYSNNNFSSSIPSHIGDYLPDLDFFSLSNNRISGIIPESICNPTSVKILDLSNNFLEGRIPGCLFSVGKGGLKILSLSGNRLSGHMPDTFPDNCGLYTLDLGGNGLEGKIPRSLSNCIFLKVLNVGNNYLEDTFPCKLLVRTLLTVLVLRSNGFHGEISCGWDKRHSWPFLQILDVAYNNLSGTLPPQLFLYCEEMMNSTTNVLRLQFGIIGMGYYHTYLDNVRLIIKGVEFDLVKIPTIYKVLDFSSNNFQGSIPDAVGELRGLYILNMSHNALTGTIPGSIGKMGQLGSLDLSKNQLTGMIPPELGDLTFLIVLNVSYNQLIGKIPGGRQMQTFPESSFLGNKGLCGFPLSLSCNHDSNNDGLLSSKGASNHKKEVDWQYVSAALGFSVGLGIILLLNFCNPIWWQRFNALIIQFLFRVFGAQVQERLYRNSIRGL